MREGKCRSHIIVEWENGRNFEIWRSRQRRNCIGLSQNAEVAKGVEREAASLELTFHRSHELKLKQRRRRGKGLYKGKAMGRERRVLVLHQCLKCEVAKMLRRRGASRRRALLEMRRCEEKRRAKGRGEWSTASG
jgi:hypothetical protein